MKQKSIYLLYIFFYSVILIQKRQILPQVQILMNMSFMSLL